MHARWIAEAFDPPSSDPQWPSEGGWSGQQDSNLRPAVPKTEVTDRIGAPGSRQGSANSLTFLGMVHRPAV